jgi:signal transduction histidine kinase
MTSGSRRVLLYWVLLLLPTLAVGGGVLWLLGREQARLDEQTRAAIDARQAAVGARARLIAENVELLVGDVKTGLMTTLIEAPADDSKLQKYLDDWKRTNPLVKATLNHTSVGEEKDRMARLTELEALLAKAVPQIDEEVEVGQVATNAYQVYNVRNQLQETAKLKGPVVVSAPQRTGWVPSRDSGGPLRLVGWRRLAFGRVIGVEVELSQIASRLGDILPADREPGEVYELREIGGAVYQQKRLSSYDRAVSASAPLITVPISNDVLPGWEVAGFLAEAPKGMSNGALFTLSAVLAGGLVTAILVGGTMLMREARRSDEEAVQKTSFVANVSHEFKTPLTTIRLYSELLEQGRVADAEKRADYLRTIGRETQRLARLVNNVLDFSRLEQGRKQFDRVELDLAAELVLLLDTHEPRVSEAGLVLRRELPSGPVIVRTDRDAVGQIVINLLDNACKYAADGREVTVSLHARTRGAEPVCNLISDKPVGVVVRVSDRGPGVAAGQRERIFEKFHRVDDALTAEKSGAGLGLSIARQLARGLGGELCYEDREGGGAEFVLTLR